MIKLKDLLLEANGDAFDCLLLPIQVDNELWNGLLGSISDSDIWDKEKGFGLEKHPHVTILYGIQPHLIQNSSHRNNINKFFTNMTPVVIETNGISIFENDKYDVLKFNVKINPILLYARRFAESLPHKTSYPEYTPHCTIAYLKKGKGVEYANKLSEKYSITSVCTHVIYSECTGNKHQIHLGLS